MPSIIRLLKQLVGLVTTVGGCVANTYKASMICDLPNKILTAIGFDLALYFMTNLRRTPGHFFVFLLFSLTCTITMSMYFRSIAALSRTLAQVGLPSFGCLNHTHEV